MNKTLGLSVTFLLVGILMTGSVLAFAVSSKYWEGNPLTINPGETQQAFIVLQNMAGTDTVNARVNILQGSEIATLTYPDKIYEIPLGEKVQVDFTVTVPTTSQVGGDYNIVFDVSTITTQEEAPMTFGAGAQKLVPVLITAKPEVKKESSPWMYYMIAGILLLAIVALAVIKSKGKQKK